MTFTLLDLSKDTVNPFVPELLLDHQLHTTTCFHGVRKVSPEFLQEEVSLESTKFEPAITTTSGNFREVYTVWEAARRNRSCQALEPGRY